MSNFMYKSVLYLLGDYFSSWSSVVILQIYHNSSKRLHTPKNEHVSSNKATALKSQPE